MAETAVVGVLRALLTLDNAEFESGLKASERELKAFASNAKNAGAQLTQIGQGLTAALTVPILGMGAASVKSAVDFESSFAGVRKTVDATEPEFQQMAQSFRDLAKEIPINVNELNRLGEAAGALGIPKEEITDFARVMAMLGVTTNVTADQAAESIAKIQNIFGAAGRDTENFASTLVSLGNAGASTEQEILALSSRIASAGNTVGLSQAQVLGFASAIANVGMEAEAGGSAMSRVFGDISAAVSQGGEAVKNFATVAGMSIAEFTTAFREDAAGATTAFIEGLGDIKESGGDLNATLTELGFTELRQADLLRRLAQSGDNLSDSLRNANGAWRENSALTEEARKRFETTESQAKLLWNQVKDLGITLGNALLPSIKATVAGFQSAIPVIESLVAGFTSLPTPIQVIGVGLLGMAAAAGPMLLLMGQMVSSAGLLATAFTKKGVAAKALTGVVEALSGGFRAFAATMVATDAALASGTAGTYALATAKGTLTAARTAATHAARAFWAALLGPVGLLAGAVAGVAGLAFAIKQLNSEASERQFVDFVDNMERFPDVASGAAIATAHLTREQLGLGKATAEYAKQGKASADTLDENALAAKRLKDNLGGGGLVRDVATLAEVLEEVQEEGEPSAGTLQRIGQHAATLKQQGAALTPALEQLAREFTNVDKNSTSAALGLKGLTEEQKKAAEQIKKNAEEIAENAKRHADVTRKRLEEEGEAVMEAYAQQNDVKEKEAAAWRAYMNFIGERQMEDEARRLAAQKGVWRTYWEDIKSGGHALFGDLNAIFQSAFEGGGNFAGAVKSMATNVVASLTSLIPVVGPIISQFSGAIVGGLSKVFGGLFGDKEHEKVNDLRDAFVEAAGGIEALNARAHDAGLTLNSFLRADTVREYEAAVRELETAFGNVEAASAFLEETLPSALQAVAESGALMTAEFMRSVQQLESVGAVAEEISAFVVGQVQGAITGITGFLVTGSQAYDSLAAKRAEVAQLTAQLDDAEGDKKDELLEKIAALNAELNAQAGIVSATAVTTTAAAEAFAGAIAASFGELQDRGMSVSEALEAIAPSVNALQAQLEAAGITGGAAFESILALVGLAEDEIAGPALDAVAQLEGAFVGLHNSGLLNQQMFEGLAGQVSQTFNALVEQGYDGNRALQLMAPTIQRIWELQQDFGYTVDENTQLLIDQAVEAGHVGDAHRDAQAVAVAAMADAAKAMQDLADVLKRVFGMAGDEAELFAERATAAVEGVPTDVEVQVLFDVERPQMPNFDNVVIGVSYDVDNPPEFHTGGIITAHSGMVLPKMDLAAGEVLVKALSGESVLDREATATLGPATVNAMNAGNWDAVMDRLGSLASPTAESLAGGSFGDVSMPSMGGVESRLDRLEASLTRSIRAQPRATAVALQDAMALAPRRGFR